MLNFKVPDSLFLVQYWLVRMIGVEPTWIAPPDPKSGASANFATSAETGGKIKGFLPKRRLKNRTYYA